MITYDEALALMLEAVVPLPGERVALEDAAGRTLAEPVMAALDAPRVAVSAMDGYAVRRADALTGDWLGVLGEAAPGSPFARSLGAGQAVRILTGAPVPDGADCVVIQEEAERSGDRVRFSGSSASAEHKSAAFRTRPSRRAPRPLAT